MFELSPYAYNFSEVDFKCPPHVLVKIIIGFVSVVFLEKVTYKEQNLFYVPMMKSISTRGSHI